MPKFCTSCGQKLEEGALFCTNCGKKVERLEKSLKKPAESVKKSELIKEEKSKKATNKETTKKQKTEVKKKVTEKIQEQTEKAAFTLPIPSKKFWAKMACGAAAICLAGCLGFFGVQAISNQQSLEGMESGVYMALSEEPLLDGVNGKPGKETITPGDLIYLKKFQEDEEGSVWGQKSTGEWVKISDMEWEYFTLSSKVEYKTEQVGKEYEVVTKTQIHAIPSGASKPLGDLDKDKVQVIETTTVEEGTIWGRIGEDRWVCLQQGKDTFLKPVEVKTETKSEEKKSAEKKNEQPTLTTYRLNYEMNVRSGADYNTSSYGTIAAGSTVQIARTQDGSRGSTWGELDKQGSGRWMCIKDSERIYLQK